MNRLGFHAQLACIWEATARKPGNVDPFHDFADTGYIDFLTSAAAIAPVMADAPQCTLGQTVLEAVRRTREVARGNTNLGIILLLAPMAKAEGVSPSHRALFPHPLAISLPYPPATSLPHPPAPSPKEGEGSKAEEPCFRGIPTDFLLPLSLLGRGGSGGEGKPEIGLAAEGAGGRSCFELEESEYRAAFESVLADLTSEDAVKVYSAIGLAAPGGLGQVSEQNVNEVPTVTLREAMALAADRDLIARQYVNGFAEVFDQGVPALLEGIERTHCLEGAIVHAHLQMMSLFPDTLIARKRGKKEADESARRASVVLEAGWPRSNPGRSALADLDGWLRAVGHQRNPGTTADLIAASLFALLRGGRLQIPTTLPWALSDAGFVESPHGQDT